MKNIRKFETTAEMESAVLEDVSISYVNEENKVYTTPENGEQDVVDYSSQYLTFEAIEDSTFNLTNNACEYSLDEGDTWTSLPAETNTPTVPAGSKIMFKIENPSIASGFSSYGIGTFSSTGKFNVKGNIMSLLYGDDFIGQNDLTDNEFAFRELFYKCYLLTEASNLILPATTLASMCYYSMFSACNSLTTVPELPATILAEYCYGYMFSGCTSLTTAPELPATTLADSCYHSMFEGCNSLTTVPELPATTLTNNCYGYMFNGCTSLTTAPELSATTLAYSCYERMFNSCTNLSKITMLATNISAYKCLEYWVRGVASTGTFTKHKDMTSLPSGVSGIPEGWTVEDAVL